jgi:hypothetical protein
MRCRYFALIANEDAFRSTLRGKIQNIIAGEIGAKRVMGSRYEKYGAFLHCYNPSIHPEDVSLAKVVEKLRTFPSTNSIGLCVH